MKMLKDERGRHRRASIVLIPDSNTIGERPAVQLVSYGQTARMSYVQRGVHGKKEKMQVICLAHRAWVRPLGGTPGLSAHVLVGMHSLASIF